ncbi:hypothetical protein VTJ04DRAFT_9211 [Mycothermus thermophilus]|uniref:uncharacterized protein n=1 Tax=Humicola insolens TaxID=85995 RepID=UPI003743FD81
MIFITPARPCFLFSPFPLLSIPSLLVGSRCPIDGRMHVARSQGLKGPDLTRPDLPRYSGYHAKSISPLPVSYYPTLSSSQSATL